METKFHLNDPLTVRTLRTGILLAAAKHRSYSVYETGSIGCPTTSTTKLSKIESNGFECFLSVSLETVEWSARQDPMRPIWAKPWEGCLIVEWAEEFVNVEHVRRFIRFICRKGVEDTPLPYGQLALWDDLSKILEWVKPHD